MGQYWIPVNLSKREFIYPHALGCGLKLWEQLANDPGTGAALIILCAAMPEARGGGDLEEDPIVGRWAGDRIALVGDYAEDGDLKDSPVPASEIYKLCDSEGADPGAFTDITPLVAAKIEKELGGKYAGTGWKRWKDNEVEEDAS